MSEVSEVLAGLRGANREAAMERLVPLVYDELPAIARAVDSVIGRA